MKQATLITFRPGCRAATQGVTAMEEGGNCKAAKSGIPQDTVSCRPLGTQHRPGPIVQKVTLSVGVGKGGGVGANQNH